jgi:hypothetical protein
VRSTAFAIFEVIDLLECGRLLDWQIGRLGTLQDFIDIARNAAPNVEDTGTVGDGSADLGEIAGAINRLNAVIGSERNNNRPLRN